MKVLFVCHGGVGRSQMARAFYNYTTQTQDANAVATDMDHLNPNAKTVREWEIENDRKSSANLVMEEFNLSTLDADRRQLTSEMLGEYDLVVNIATKEQSPSWLLGNNVIWWDISDPGFSHTLEEVRATRDEIKKRVLRLVELERSDGDFHELDDNIDEGTQ